MKWSQSQALSKPSASNNCQRSTSVAQGRFWSVTIPNRTVTDGIILWNGERERIVAEPAALANHHAKLCVGRPNAYAQDPGRCRRGWYAAIRQPQAAHA